MLKTKFIALISYVCVCVSVNCIPYLSVQDTYAVSDVISVNDMDFTIRNGTTDQLLLTAYNGYDSILVIPEKIEDKIVTAVDDKVFFENVTLTDITLPDSINYFGADVFKDSLIQSVNVPKSLTVIPSYTFNNCQELEDVSFHDNIAIISNTAFKKTNITIPQELRGCVTGTVILSSDSSCQFSNGDWNYTITCKNGVTNAEILKYNGSDVVISVPSRLNNADVTICNKKTFPDINTIKYIEFPDAMFSLDISFAGSNLKEIIARGVSEIPASEFTNCINLTEVTISDKVDLYSIGSNAFKNCSSLKYIPLPEKCERVNIGSEAFENTAITEISLKFPSKIGSGAFSRCNSLHTVELTNAEVSPRTFMDCSELTEISFLGKTILDDLSIYDCDNLVNVNFTDCELSSYDAFRNCPKLYTLNSEKVFNTISDDFIPKYKDFIFSHFNGSDNVGFINDYVNAQVKKIVKEYTDDNMTDIEKVLVLHDWVCNNTKYTEGDVGDRENHNDASVFMNEYTVCEGYARACNLLYHAAGLETYYVHSADHAWNIVNVEDHYFHIDSTWDDGDIICRKWFMLSDDEMKTAGGSHAVWTLSEPSPLHEFQDDLLPLCEYTMGDVNVDGTINIADLVLLQNHILGRSSLENEHWILSDVCFDGKIDVFDIVELRKKVIFNLSISKN